MGHQTQNFDPPPPPPLNQPITTQPSTSQSQQQFNTLYTLPPSSTNPITTQLTAISQVFPALLSLSVTLPLLLNHHSVLPNTPLLQHFRLLLIILKSFPQPLTILH